MIRRGPWRSDMRSVRSILVFLSGSVDGVGIVEQALQAGVELGYDTYTVPFGSDTESTSYALGFATRSALTFGGLKGGMAKEILEYNEHRTFAFALALGHIDDLKYAIVPIGFLKVKINLIF